MNAYQKMQLHLEKHAYTKGKNEGEAPLDKRWKSYFRVPKPFESSNVMTVRLHKTDILTVNRDGSFKIHCNDWVEHPSTREAVWRSVAKFCSVAVNLYVGTVMGKKQIILSSMGKTYAYYDGMTFDALGNLTSEPRPFLMRRIDRVQSKAYTQAIKDSGFKGMFPILYETATLEASRASRSSYTIREITSTRELAHDWPTIIADSKFSCGPVGWYPIPNTVKSTWTAIMAATKAGMYKTLVSDVTVM